MEKLETSHWQDGNEAGAEGEKAFQQEHGETCFLKMSDLRVRPKDMGTPIPVVSKGAAWSGKLRFLIHPAR